jgi:hypothetical protein
MLINCRAKNPSLTAIIDENVGAQPFTGVSVAQLGDRPEAVTMMVRRLAFRLS